MKETRWGRRRQQIMNDNRWIQLHDRFFIGLSDSFLPCYIARNESVRNIRKKRSGQERFRISLYVHVRTSSIAPGVACWILPWTALQEGKKNISSIPPHSDSAEIKYMDSERLLWGRSYGFIVANLGKRWQKKQWQRTTMANQNSGSESDDDVDNENEDE